MKKILALILISIMTITCFASCSRSDTNVDSDYYPEYDSSYDSDVSMGESGKLQIDGITSDGPSWGLGSGGSSNSNSNSSSNNNSSLPSVNDQQQHATKIIKNFTLSAETKEFDQAIADLEQLLVNYNGYIENSSIVGNTYGDENVKKRTAKYSIRIPSENAENFVKSATGLLNVTNSTSTVQDISLSYYTMQRQLEILGSEKIALQKMLEGTNSTSTILDIRRQLTSVITEMETLQTKLAVYDSQVSYSTIKLNVYEVVEYTKIKTLKFGDRFVDAIKGSWLNAVSGVQEFIIWFIYAIPALIVTGGLVALAIFIYIKAKKHGNNPIEKIKKHKKEKVEQPEEPEDPLV